MKTLEEEWRQYRDTVYPAKNGPLSKFQETETRQAFYAGALVVLTLATERAAGLGKAAAYASVVALIKEAETVCRERIYEMKGRN